MPSRSHRIAAFSALVLAALAFSSPPSIAQRPVVRGKLGKALDAQVRGLDQAAGGFVGSAFVARGKTVLLDRGYGIADVKKKRAMPVNALWDWASVSKQFTAAAILKLQMQKKLSIEDSIAKHYPKAAANKKPIKIRHMLNHTSGIDQSKRPAGVDFRKRDAVVKYFLQMPVANKPGAKWEYSNLTYFVLAALVEKVSGTTFERYCIKHLFRPAGMKDACFIGSPGLDLDRVPREDRGAGKHFAYGYALNWGYKGSGGTIATPREMWKWDRALRGKKILSKAAKKAYYRVGQNNYALGWSIREWPKKEIGYEHSGAVGKTVTYYLRLKKSKIVVALAYTYKPAVHPERTAHALAKLVLDKQ